MQCKPYANDYYQLCLTLPFISKQALPGHYINLNQQWPFYIMGNDPTLDVLIPKTLKEQCEQQNFQNVSHAIELHGIPLNAPHPTQFNLLIAQNDELSACLFYLRKYRKQFRGLVLIGTDRPFAFNPCPSRHLLVDMPPDVIASLPLLEDWKIAHRLASTIEMPGVYHGCVQDLATRWLEKSKLSAVNAITFSPVNTFL